MHYNDACLKDLQVYTNREPGWIEHLFATTIILQVMEEMNGMPAFLGRSFGRRTKLTSCSPMIAVGMPAGADGTGHLKGMYCFVQDLCLEPGTVAAACFWVGLRQDIYSAVEKSQPVRMNLAYDLVDRSLGPTDDYTWANRAVVHCADVLNFCFGSEREQVRRWDELNCWNQEWTNGRPDTFDPLFKQNKGSAPFPAIWHHQNCQGKSGLAVYFLFLGQANNRFHIIVIGVQHHLLAKLFLLDHRLKFGNGVTGKETFFIQVSLSLLYKRPRSRMLTDTSLPGPHQRHRPGDLRHRTGKPVDTAGHVHGLHGDRSL